MGRGTPKTSPTPKPDDGPGFFGVDKTWGVGRRLKPGQKVDKDHPFPDVSGWCSISVTRGKEDADPPIVMTGSTATHARCSGIGCACDFGHCAHAQRDRAAEGLPALRDHEAEQRAREEAEALAAELEKEHADAH